jgi:hypothetical protein
MLESYPEEVSVPQPARVKKPRRQLVASKVVEPSKDEPFSLWYEDDTYQVPKPDTAERLWTELDRIDLPLEGEPHDLWWSETSKG